uniref:Carboxylesterase type B domain-containing protein n=1 Tax=Ditylenchus dipsaci TaxID=166011 RepID=A0A915CLD3_9BILA
MQTKSPFKGVIHGAEYPFAVGVHIFGTYEMDQEDYLVRNTMITAFGNFVKTSNPSTQNLRWPLLKKGDRLKSVHIGVKSFVETEPKHIMQRLHFWDSLSSKHNFSQIQGFPTLKT